MIIIRKVSSEEALDRLACKIPRRHEALQDAIRNSESIRCAPCPPYLFICNHIQRPGCINLRASRCLVNEYRRGLHPDSPATIENEDSPERVDSLSLIDLIDGRSEQNRCGGVSRAPNLVQTARNRY